MQGFETEQDFIDLLPEDAKNWEERLADEVNGAGFMNLPVGVVQLPPDLIFQANEALALHADGQPLDAEQAALRKRALQWIMRPALRIDATGPKVDSVVTAIWGEYAAQIVELVARWAPSVARVDAALPSGRVHVGTAWPIGTRTGERLFVTNRHVINACHGLATWLDFGVYVGPGTAVPITAPPLVHPTQDLALLRVAAASAPAVPDLPLAGTVPQHRDAILVIGHPGEPLPEHRDAIVNLVGFDAVWGVKRASPGLARSSHPVSRADWVGSWAHDATTLGGNSGSPVFDLRSGRVLGVHAGGLSAHTVPWFLMNRALPVALSTDSFFAGIVPG
jgi:endonuclease G